MLRPSVPHGAATSADRAMKTVFDLTSEPGIILGVARGRLTLPDLREAAAQFWREVRAPEARVLWDLREATFDLSSDDVRTFAEFGKRESPFAGLRMAFVVTRDLEYGLVRMFEVFRENSRTQTAVFRDRAQAVEWLTGGSA